MTADDLALDLLSRARALIKDKGVKLQDAAIAMGIDAPKLSKILKGERRPQFIEVTKLAHLLRVPAFELMEMFGVDLKYMGGPIKVVTGMVWDNDAVLLYPPNFKPYQIGLNLSGDETIVVVASERFGPRYNHSEHIAFSEGQYITNETADPYDLALTDHYGHDAVVMTEAGDMLLKRVQAGERKFRYTLLSLDAKIAPIFNVALRWAAPIRIHIPGSAFHAWTKGPLDEPSGE